ncbi:MAG: hypothetical protein WB988_11970, partial [Candidatus Nitrosopolaris sp.]
MMLQRTQSHIIKSLNKQNGWLGIEGAEQGLVDKMLDKSSMIKGLVPRSGIDTDARWRFSHTKQWMFGYKLHITSSTGSLIIPLSADFTQADVQDNQRY